MLLAGQPAGKSEHEDRGRDERRDLQSDDQGAADLLFQDSRCPIRRRGGRHKLAVVAVAQPGSDHAEPQERCRDDRNVDAQLEGAAGSGLELLVEEGLGRNGGLGGGIGGGGLGVSAHGNGFL